MPSIPNVSRRGAVYYWRKRLPHSPRCKPGFISISLKTADARIARFKATRLAASSLMAFEKVRRGMLTREEINAIIRIKAQEIDADIEAEMVAFRSNGGMPNTNMLGLGWDEYWAVMAEAQRRRASVLAEPEPNFREREVLKAKGWSERMLDKLDAALDLAGWFGPRAFKDSQLQELASQVGLDRDLSPEEFDQIDRAALRGAAVAYDKHARTFRIDSDQDIDLVYGEGSANADLSRKVFRQPVEVSSAPTSEYRPVTESVPRPEQRVSSRSGTPISEIASALFSDKAGEKAWDAKSLAQAQSTIRLFAGYLENEFNIGTVEEIEQKHLDHFDGMLKVLSPLHGKAAEDRDLSVNGYLAKYTPPRSTHNAILSAKTRNRYWVYIGQLIARAKRRGIDTSRLDVSQFWTRAKYVNARDERAQPKAEAVKTLFHLPVFTGCAGFEHRKVKGLAPMDTPGAHVFHRAAYFVPIIAYYHGFRREEICGLDVDDIEEVDGIPAIAIRWNANRRIKNAQSRRTHALHPEIIRLGFLEYVRAIKQLGYRRVFPDLVSPESKSPSGDRLYDEMAFSFRKADFTTHQMRHFFNNNLKQKGVSEEIRQDFMGHKGGSETSNRYADALEVRRQLEELTKLDMVTAHLAPMPIRLLLWVERRQPAPWARRPRRIPIAKAPLEPIAK